MIIIMKFEDLKPGIMIEDPQWYGQVTLEQFENVGECTKLTIRRDNGNKNTVRVNLRHRHTTL